MTLLRAVMSIGRNAGGVIPKGISIDFESAANGDTDNHMALIKWCEGTQSKVIVGGTLLSQADGKTSTNAQSKTHENQFDMIIESDAKQLARSLNDTLISYLMRLNYPNITADRYPEFYFDLTETEDLAEFSQSLDTLVDTGLKIPMSWVYDRTGIPMPEGDEPILTKQSNSPILAANTYQPHLINQSLAANAMQVPLEDQAMQLQLNQQLESSQVTAENWLNTLIADIQAGANEEQVLAVLSQLHPQDDEPALQAKLTQIIFACDVLGRLSAQSEL